MILYGLLICTWSGVRVGRRWAERGVSEAGAAWDNFSILLLLYLDREPGGRH